MFTGLIETVGTIVSKQVSGNATKLIISSNLPIAEIALGDSIAVNGTCLTVEKKNNNELTFHVLNETMSLTNLAKLGNGTKVNLEQALQVGSRLGGHFVSGHIDTTSKIMNIQQREHDICLTIALPSNLKELFIHKGSIAINGISLTIAELTNSSFSVCLIPHTWHNTNLEFAKIGDAVNLECDIIGKYIIRNNEVKSASITMETLYKAGF